MFMPIGVHFSANSRRLYFVVETTDLGRLSVMPVQIILSCTTYEQGTLSVFHHVKTVIHFATAVGVNHYSVHFETSEKLE